MSFKEAIIGTYKDGYVYRLTKEKYLEKKFYNNFKDLFIVDDLVVMDNCVIGEVVDGRIKELPVKEVRRFCFGEEVIDGMLVGQE